MFDSYLFNILQLGRKTCIPHVHIFIRKLTLFTPTYVNKIYRERNHWVQLVHKVYLAAFYSFNNNEK